MGFSFHSLETLTELILPSRHYYYFFWKNTHGFSNVLVFSTITVNLSQFVLYMTIYVHLAKINEKLAMNLKVNMEGYMRGFGGKKKKEGDVLL